jgi:YgiT-type zinc finger domain-containing protein
MSTDSTDAFEQVQRELTAWHSTHPRATFAEIETAVEAQLDQLRQHLLTQHAQAGFHEERPQCARCGATMVVKARKRRSVILRGDHVLKLERPYLVCPSCGEGLFPPR